MRQKLLFSLIVLLTSTSSFAQESFWKKLVPDEASVQYAGSIGFTSLGAGYDLFNEKASLSTHLGFVPQSLGGDITIVTLKYQHKLYTVPINDKIVWKPFNPVAFISYTLGENFDFKFEKPQYREGYYFWSSAMRLHLGANTEVRLLSQPNSKIKAISLYAEVNTNDLYAISWFHNRTSSNFLKILKMGYGVKMHF